MGSSNLFQLTTNKEIKALNATSLGVPIADECISALALADDKSLIANSVKDTQTLLDESVKISSSSNYEYGSAKTKILVINPQPSKKLKHSPIPLDATRTVNGLNISSSSQATHLGVV